MTDKQIIFDDVDVKDCIAYAKSQEIYLGNTLYKQMEKVCMVKNQPCKYFDCQFKQMTRELKAKEQECEELKRYKSLFEKTRDLWNEASKTNYKLLDEIEDLKDSLKRTICQSECYKHKKAEKLSKTLIEIKEIAENAYCLTNATNKDMAQFAKQILQKISECEE